MSTIAILEHTKLDDLEISQGNFLNFCKKWESPSAIISDGPYGVGGFPGDPVTAENLGEIYHPYIKAWSLAATPNTTLWFWNTELGWANVHPYLEKEGWEYISCHIWNKGKAHVAGNVNTKTIRKLPVVTEVCVQYVKKATFKINNQNVSMQDWLRHEWKRSGLPFSKTNEACGVKNAASRKYFTNCHLWYFPPAEAFEKFSSYANQHGLPTINPYFSIDGKVPTKEEWEKYRATFNCPFGMTNVWDLPPLNGSERLKKGSKALHLNQKPLKLMEALILMSTNENDTIWEPFGGLCSASVAALNLNRKACTAEINPEVFHYAKKRIQDLFGH